jgi:hypothetical protein
VTEVESPENYFSPWRKLIRKTEMAKDTNRLVNDALDCLVLYTIVALAQFGPIHLTEALSLFLLFPFPPPPALGFWNPTTNVDEANARPPLNAIATMVDMGYHDA